MVKEFLIRYDIAEISLLFITPEGIKVSSVINCYHFQPYTQRHEGIKHNKKQMDQK